MYYERVRSDLQQAERTIIIALRSNIDLETEKRALEESLNLVQEAAEKCRLAQAESIRKTFSQGMSME
ncbi:hypothetical protein CE91St54_28940 [Hungatella hathewayi]|jgi:hypothetical protein|uniref:Uncharacterized protein n=1 Tax=Hungatella hathewayi TaxID=154046 RepID=A0AA37JM36_9FIRM|nr:hypothetical protein [Hungatella hathewayi]GKH04126.1 hypothetical protein CE91St55_61070 [Hungatella hathewayi]GKH07786.1 hypothetical protein CE91St54_28940 [Hungatella hathewayi]